MGIDSYRQYIYDISIQILLQCFVDSMYSILYRYCLLTIIPLMIHGYSRWFHPNALIVILLHNVFYILVPTLFSTELFYDNFVNNDSMPWIVEKVLSICNVYDGGDSIKHFHDWRERYS